MQAQVKAMEFGPGKFRALDPELPLLAARAAAELDSLILAAEAQTQCTVTPSAVAQLAARLSKFHPSSGDGPARALADPVSADVFARAYMDSKHENIRTFEDLEKAAATLATALDAAKEQKYEGVALLKVLRDFCVALSNYSASKRHFAFDVRPAPFFRRLGTV